MKIVRINTDQVDQDVVRLAADILKAGGIVCHPTDTCYGLATDVFNPEAINRLIALKKMHPKKPISLIATSLEDILSWVEVSVVAKEFMVKYWPGALTLVLRKKAHFPDYYNPGHPSIGIRQPKCNYSLALCKAFGRFITTTSANISGEKPSYSLIDILEQFSNADDRPDLVLDGGPLEMKRPSTVVEIVSEAYKVLREGEVRV